MSYWSVVGDLALAFLVALLFRRLLRQPIYTTKPAWSPTTLTFTRGVKRKKTSILVVAGILTAANVTLGYFVYDLKQEQSREVNASFLKEPFPEGMAESGSRNNHSGRRSRSQSRSRSRSRHGCRRHRRR